MVLLLVTAAVACTVSSAGADDANGASSPNAGSSTGQAGQVSAPPLRWASWVKGDFPNWQGQDVPTTNWSLASDPSVIRYPRTGELHMFYTCISGLQKSSNGGLLGGICHVKSADANAGPTNWTFTGPSATSPLGDFYGVALKARPLRWDANTETCSIYLTPEGEFDLYYSGYLTRPNDNRPGASLGVVTSTDGETFAHTGLGLPVLQPTPGGPDSSDIFSATVFTDEDNMTRAVYVGWCVVGYHQTKACRNGPAVMLLGATKSQNGTWIKESRPVLEPDPSNPLLKDGVAEPYVLHGPDGKWYLFFTAGLGDNEPRVTMVGVSEDGAFGPWNLSPQPAVKPVAGVRGWDACGTFAPTVLVEANRTRMWYLGLDDCKGTCASCNAATCGCAQNFAIGYAEATWPLLLP